MIYMLQCLGTFMLDKLTERLAGLPDQLTVLLHELLWVLGESVPWSIMAKLLKIKIPKQVL